MLRLALGIAVTISPRPSAALPTAARADAPSLAAYRVAWLPELAATLALFGVVGIGQGVVNQALPGGHPCVLAASGDRCDPARLIPLDRLAVGQHSAAWRQASDAGMLFAVLAPLAAGLGDGLLAGTGHLAADAAAEGLVLLESVAVATAINQAFKYAVRRPRPGLFTPGPQSVEGALSFPSGHTAAVAAAGAAYTTTFARRHPAGPARLWVGAGAVLLTAATGYGRVAGGMHFPSDVIAGALLGGAAGIVLPWLHPNGRIRWTGAATGGHLQLDLAL